MLKARDVDKRFARLQVAMGTPKYLLAERLNITVRTLNSVLKNGSSR